MFFFSKYTEQILSVGSVDSGIH